MIINVMSCLLSMNVPEGSVWAGGAQAWTQRNIHRDGSTEETPPATALKLKDIYGMIKLYSLLKF